jgi:hypothetical protein
MAPGNCLNFTRNGSVVVAAGDIVPSNNADAVFIVVEDGDPEADADAAICADRDRVPHLGLARDPSSRIRKPWERVRGLEGPVGIAGLLMGESALGESDGVLRKQSLLPDEDEEAYVALLRSFFLHVRDAGKEAGEETCRGC